MITQVDINVKRYYARRKTMKRRCTLTRGHDEAVGWWVAPGETALEVPLLRTAEEGLTEGRVAALTRGRQRRRRPVGAVQDQPVQLDDEVTQPAAAVRALGERDGDVTTAVVLDDGAVRVPLPPAA